MGTRADFYVGLDQKAEWLGSVAYDGNPGNFPTVEKAKTETVFRAAVESILAQDENATVPEDGWPWPWKDSNTSDYAFAFHNGEVFHTQYPEKGSGNFWVKCSAKKNRNGYKPLILPTDFPDMTARANVKMPGSAGSGVMLFTRR